MARFRNAGLLVLGAMLGAAAAQARVHPRQDPAYAGQGGTIVVADDSQTTVGDGYGPASIHKKPVQTASRTTVGDAPAAAAKRPQVADSTTTCCNGPDCLDDGERRPPGAPRNDPGAAPAQCTIRVTAEQAPPAGDDADWFTGPAIDGRPMRVTAVQAAPAAILR